MDDSILNVVHNTAKGLHKSGAMDKETMKEFDSLCLPPVKSLSAAQIKQLRRKNKVSQAVLAAYINTSTSTVQKWEQGQKKPNGTAMKLLNLIANKGLEAVA